jgi:hypothetical protein
LDKGRAAFLSPKGELLASKPPISEHFWCRGGKLQ